MSTGTNGRISITAAPTNSRFIRQEDVRRLLCDTCDLGGSYAVFGYHSHNIGTHSLRSGAAMALFLAHTSILKIMILGRWSSCAFMNYIRPQVLEWTSNLSALMLNNPDFRHAHSSSSSTATNNQDEDIYALLDLHKPNTDPVFDPASKSTPTPELNCQKKPCLVAPRPLPPSISIS